MLNRISFQKPDLAELTQQYTCVDMHFHTEHSDTYTKVNDILKRCKQLNVGVALTDHNEIRGVLEAMKSPEVKNNEAFIIPGIEVSCKECPHILVYFYQVSELVELFEKHIKDRRGGNPWLSTSIGTEELFDILDKYNCIAGPAHPVAYPKRFSCQSQLKAGKVNLDVIDQFDSIEVINGANVRRMNLKGIEWCNHLGKCFHGGSDGHILRSLGSVVTYAQCDKNIDAFLDAIRKKENYVMGKEINIPTRLLPFSRIAGRHLTKYFRPTMLSQYEISIKQPAVKTARLVKQGLSKINNVRKIQLQKVKAKIGKL